MVSFGSALLGKNQIGGIPNPEPLSKPILDAISHAVVMAMEKQLYNCEKKKAKSPSSSSKTSSA